MADTAKSFAPDNLVPTDEIVRLHRLGFSLLPLGRGSDGKSPLTAFAGKAKFELRQVLGPLHGKNSGCYGIRLDGLLVIDCDEDNPALINELEARFGVSPIHVRTPRGLHLYYKDNGARPNLRAEGLPVDIKSSANSYVVGPHSVRPDGGLYVPQKGILGKHQLPVLRVQTVASPAFKVGERNRALTKAAIEMALCVDSFDELLGNLQFIRDERAESPETVSEAELMGIARWAWQKRLDNNVFAGRNSEFRVQRTALDVLKSMPKSSDAIALYTVLADLHGHRPERPFALSWSGMADAGHIDLSKRRFVAARRMLQRAGVIHVVSSAVQGTRHQTFRFTRIYPGQRLSSFASVPKV